MDSLNRPGYAKTPQELASIVQVLKPLKDVYLPPDIPRERLAEALKYANLLEHECLAVCVQSKRGWLQREWGWAVSRQGLHWQHVSTGFVSWERLVGIDATYDSTLLLWAVDLDGTTLVHRAGALLEPAKGVPVASLQDRSQHRIDEDMRIFVPNGQAEPQAHLLWQVRNAMVAGTA